MRKAALLTLGVYLAAPILLSAQLLPDPHDSIILESRAVAANLTGSPAFRVKVYITNKDSISYMVLAVAERTIAGTAYALLNRTGSNTLTYASVVTNLTNTLRYYTGVSFGAYNNASPDSFLVMAGFDGANLETIEPPNAVRKPVWELKFRHSSDSAGQVLLYRSVIAGAPCHFVNTRPVNLPVNFLPGVITVISKGDLNLGGDGVTGADIVWEIRCIFGGETPPAGRSACDLNCDGEITASDIVVMLTYNFVTLIWPC